MCFRQNCKTPLGRYGNKKLGSSIAELAPWQQPPLAPLAALAATLGQLDAARLEAALVHWQSLEAALAALPNESCTGRNHWTC